MVLSGAGAVRTALWVVPVAELGGVARHVLDTVHAGVPGWRLVVLCPEGPLAERLRALGAAVLTGPVSPAAGTLRAVRTLRRALRTLRPALLHTHLAFADLAGVTAATGIRTADGRRLPVVSTEHGIAGVPGLYRPGAAQAHLRQAAHRARLHRTDRVIAVSDSTAAQIAAQWGRARQVTVIRNGVDLPSPPTAPRPGLRVLSLSRLAPEKRIDRLLDAFAVVAASHPEARLTIAGDGPEAGALQARARQLQISERVRFPGHVEADAALREHDVVVQLSAWENLSYTLLDAVAHGLGVVATDVGGNREIVPSRCLTDAADPQAVAAAIVEQGMERERRPEAHRPGGSVAAMCARIAFVYEELS
ncbi:glycosyltransferase [Brachybacterium saurashtrense]|uniref:Glycosyltransferase n=1 Tax=Brachybacterium saurashtrense TaxID=556288 RepID=A0A345YSF3_9MICO|nr:glycosyltransferase [Brachybacterium saurashtrense]AXK46855.1 glycosyltransferase [Brachybacterium saurashtrense]RRR22570.1 glycosyltransferase [Brachybacterium saurashtrense]